MQNLGTQELTTTNLILRKFNHKDAEALFEGWASNEDVTKFANWQTHATLDETKKVIGGWVKQYTTKPGFYRWAVEIEETHKVIGSVYVMFSYNDVRLFDVDFCFAPQYEKSDFAVEALNAVSEFLFVKVGANRVQVRLDTEDTAKEEVLKKCTMDKEGVVRGGFINNQGIRDYSLYSAMAK